MKLYVLGAGFSKAFSSAAPMINDYFQNIESKELKAKFDNYKLLGIGNNEQIASLFLEDNYLYDYVEKLEHKKYAHYLLCEIGRKVRNITPNNVSDFQQVVDKYFKRTLDNDISVVTFNYDTLIEDAYENASYSIELMQNPYNEMKQFDGGIWGEGLSLLKLHGSVNWFKCSEDENSNVSNIFFCNKEDESYTDISLRQAPVIVPFSFNKTAYLAGNLFDLLWKRFIQLLDRADSIEFVGYSFPYSDFQIISQIGKYKSKIKKIVVMEEDGTNIDRLVRIFGRCIVNKDAADEYR